MAHKTTRAKANQQYIDELRKKQELRRKQEQRMARQLKPRPQKAVMPQAAPATFDKEPTKDLCVGTIFPDCSELSTKWLDLQLKYLNASTSVPYEHFSVVQKDANDYFRNKTRVLSPRKGGRNSQGHVNGLVALRDFFLREKADYKYFLFIDMDAFPIRNDWYDVITNKITSRKYELAVALRPENLEQRLHSSILMVPRDTLPKLNWQVSKVGPDLIGGTESDVQLCSHQTGAMRNKSFVLLRSNMHQIHPLLCGVYYDLFYHHCCGSGRNFNMRARPYWAHVTPLKFDVMKSINDLMGNPNEFIGKLVGWEESKYAKV